MANLTKDKAAIHPFLDGKLKKLFIGGEWVDAHGGAFDCIDPSTGHTVAEVAQADEVDVDRAVAAARQAFEGDWSRWKPYDRQVLMLRIADLLEDRFAGLGLIESIDMGAPVARTNMFKRWMQQAFPVLCVASGRHSWPCAGEQLSGRLYELYAARADRRGRRHHPWNGPLITQLWSICPALATGCTLVLKPALEAPLSALMLAEILQEAGVPDGVVNVVPGPGPTAGAALAGHGDVNRIAFTGSTATGRKIVQAAATNMKTVATELGGKSPISFSPMPISTKPSWVCDGVLLEHRAGLPRGHPLARSAIHLRRLCPKAGRLRQDLESGAGAGSCYATWPAGVGGTA